MASTRLEREGLITSRLVASSSGPARKYYVPTARGAAELARSARSWRELTITVKATLGRASPRPEPADAHTPHTPEETP